ncbi:hypothetical protein BpHYR1_045537 [Brachionus plicatilis]|uniref:Uncharacterized protein n=1 Tax=Brachionus plicatilis TaxID=10195 RepID=A0A3M7SD82_BRAPC|nr:hypothetical protein BpHYR1_045537 [Brachionus plicatilis]
MSLVQGKGPSFIGFLFLSTAPHLSSTKDISGSPLLPISTELFSYKVSSESFSCANSVPLFCRLSAVLLIMHTMATLMKIREKQVIALCNKNLFSRIFGSFTPNRDIFLKSDKISEQNASVFIVII